MRSVRELPIDRIRDKCGRPARRPFYLTVDLAELREAYVEGYSLRQLGAYYGVSRSTVRRALVRAR